MSESNGSRRLGLTAQIAIPLVVGIAVGWVGSVSSGLTSISDLRTEVAVLKVRLEATNRRLDETNTALGRVAEAIRGAGKP